MNRKGDMEQNEGDVSWYKFHVILRRKSSLHHIGKKCMFVTFLLALEPTPTLNRKLQHSFSTLFASYIFPFLFHVLYC